MHVPAWSRRGGQGQQEGTPLFHCYWADGADVRHMALPGGVLTKTDPRPIATCQELAAVPPGRLVPT